MPSPDTTVVLLAVLVVLAGTEGGGRLVARRLLRHRLAQVGEPLGEVEVGLPRRPLLPDLLRLRMPAAALRCGGMELPTVRLAEVRIELWDIRLDLRAAVRAGHGTLTGQLPPQEVRRLAGVGGDLRITDGLLTMRWTTVPGLPAVRVRLRPVLSSGRIRLAPTPVSMALPPLPAGVHVTDVQAVPGALQVRANLELARLLN